MKSVTAESRAQQQHRFKKRRRKKHEPAGKRDGREVMETRKQSWRRQRQRLDLSRVLRSTGAVVIRDKGRWEGRRAEAPGPARRDGAELTTPDRDTSLRGIRGRNPVVEKESRVAIISQSILVTCWCFYCRGSQTVVRVPRLVLEALDCGIFCRESKRSKSMEMLLLWLIHTWISLANSSYKTDRQIDRER